MRNTILNLLKDAALADPATKRLLTDEEMEESGYAGKAAFGICANEGYYFKSVNNEKGEWEFVAVQKVGE